MAIVSTADAMDRLLNALADGATLKEASARAGVSPAAHYRWLESDFAYQEGYKLALTLRTRVLEDELNRRAIEGFDEVKTTYTLLPDGTEMATEKIVTRKYDNALAIRMLSANDERYNTKIKQEITNSTTVAEILAARRRVLAAEGSDASEENEDTTEA